MKRWLFIILLGWASVADSQINNTLLEDSIVLNDTLQEQLCLSVYNNNFFRNNEYFHDIAQGYTLFGSQLKTQLAYVINPHARIQAGLYARKDFGNDGFTTLAPMLSIKLQKNGYSALMGNLEGNLSHRLYEPIYDYERFLLHHLENGLQFKIDRQKIWADTWMNWEVQQYLNDDFQEQFSAGHSSKITLYKNSSKGWEVLLPLQLLVSHKGGQLDIDSTPLKTLANMGTGFTLVYKNKMQNNFIQAVNFDYFFTYFNDLSPTKTLNYHQGNGTYIKFNALSRYDIGAALSVWSGKEYLSSRGSYLFQSEASIYGTKGYTETQRSLLFLKLFYQHRVWNAIDVDIRFEPYVDLRQKYFEYSYSVYFTYKKDFTLYRFADLHKQKRN